MYVVGEVLSGRNGSFSLSKEHRGVCSVVRESHAILETHVADRQAERCGAEQVLSSDQRHRFSTFYHWSQEAISILDFNLKKQNR